MIPYTQGQIKAALDEIEKQTDRGAALIAASVIDGLLEHLIIARLVELSSNRKKELFEQSNGPLRSLSSKIELGFALGLFNEERRQSLHLIRDVRNAFAHRMDPISFEDPEISTKVETRVTAKVKAYIRRCRHEQSFCLRSTFLLSFSPSQHISRKFGSTHSTMNHHTTNILTRSRL